MADQKNYITPEGFATLEAEFNQLLKVERPEVVRVVSWAASNGDRSENGDSFSWKAHFQNTSHDVQEHIDSDFKSTFHHLLHADLLIGSKSGMTHLAGMLGDQIKLVPKMWHSYRGAEKTLELSSNPEEQRQLIEKFLSDHLQSYKKQI